MLLTHDQLGQTTAPSLTSGSFLEYKHVTLADTVVHSQSVYLPLDHTETVKAENV